MSRLSWDPLKDEVRHLARGVLLLYQCPPPQQTGAALFYVDAYFLV